MKKLMTGRGLRAYWLVVFAVFLSTAWSALAAEAPVKEATLEYNFRPIVTFRTLFVGATPEIRVQRALERIKKLTPAQMELPVEVTPFAIGDVKAVGVRIGNNVVFNVLDGDLDPEEKLTLDEVAKRASAALSEALRSESEQRRPERLLKGMALALVATVLAYALLLGVRRAELIVEKRFQQVVEREDGPVRWRWARHGLLLIQRVAQLLMVLLWLGIANFWLAYLLSLFPLTEPLSNQLGGFVFYLL